MEIYCEKNRETGEYQYFFKNKVAVLMCGAKEEDIKKVRVAEVEVENPTHWAYFDKADNEYRFIFKTEVQVKMCSPDSFKSSIEEGEGKIVKIKVEELE